MPGLRVHPLLLALSLLPAAVACQRANADVLPQIPVATAPIPLAHLTGRDSVVFAGGCFWGVEAVFERVNGVVDVISGYAGGELARPSYEQVSAGATGHAESVKIVFDPATVSYSQLLRVFFSVAHDPTQLNFQGPDHGPQYRSAIFTASAEQRSATDAYVRELTAAHVFRQPIVTQVAGWQPFHEAEAYHQGYYDAHPDALYIVFNDKPKVAALQREFPDLYRSK